MKCKNTCRTFSEFLIEWLQDPDKAYVYLGVVLEEYARDQDLKALLRSLNNIAIAKGGVLQLSESSEIDQRSLDKLLAKDSNPTWEGVLEALGYAFLLPPYEAVPSY